MIKYLGSKRTLIPYLGAIAKASEAKTAVDLFTGTTRVAQEFKRQNILVTANDLASYSEVLANCYIATDADQIDLTQLSQIIDSLNAVSGKPGYFTETFCIKSRFFQPKNGERVDAIRDEIAEKYAGSIYFPILLTSLMEAADKVDSTTGVQMAYLKQWAKRAEKDLQLKVPQLIPGTGQAICGDAVELVSQLPKTDLMYLDPPYNQHRYFSNYHIWETLVRWDKPDHYGVACKRVDVKSQHTKSVLNSKVQMPDAFRSIISAAKAQLMVVSYNDESWISADEMVSALQRAGYASVKMLSFDYRRYVGAQIGIFNPAGKKVGEVKKLRNTEYLFLAGDSDQVAACVAAVEKVSSKDKK